MTQMKCLECWWTISWISQVLLDLWMELAKLATRLLCTEMDVGTLSLRNIPGWQSKTWNHWNHWNHCVTSFFLFLFRYFFQLFCFSVSTSQIFVSSIHWISGFTKAASAGSRSFSPRFWANCSARKALKVRLAISKSTLSCFKMKDDGTSEDFNLEKKNKLKNKNIQKPWKTSLLENQSPRQLQGHPVCCSIAALPFGTIPPPLQNIYIPPWKSRSSSPDLQMDFENLCSTSNLQMF